MEVPLLPLKIYYIGKYGTENAGALYKLLFVVLAIELPQLHVAILVIDI